MVSVANQLQKTSAPSDDEDSSECDDVSVGSSSGEECDGTVVLSEADNGKSPCFQNIEVTNSSDVHFGNKTYYQGPVTIKQILYAKDGGSALEQLEYKDKDKCDIDLSDCNGKDNGAFETDAVPQANGLNRNSDKTNIESQTPVGKGGKWLKTLSKKQYVLVISMAVLAMVILASITTVIVTQYLPQNNKPSARLDGPEQDDDSGYDEPTDDFLILDGIKLRIISRRTWLAQHVTHNESLHHPVPYVIIMHTATESCNQQPQCIFYLRQIQSFDIESRGMVDISYNFLLGADGSAYEGVGWKNEGSHTDGYNNRSLGIAFIGTYKNLQPKQKQIDAAFKLIRLGLEKRFVDKNFTLLCATQLSSKNTEKSLCEIVKKWKHWTSDP